MIKFKEFNERFAGSYKNQDSSISDIFVNPSKSEIRKEIGDIKFVRFIIDIKNKNIYIADANKSLHFYMWMAIDISPKSLSQAKLSGDIIAGYTEFGKPVFEILDVPQKALESIFTTDFTWADKVIPGLHKAIRLKVTSLL
jgi:hypothetical protein